MGLQRFPYKLFEGINLSDGPFDIPTSKSPDCYNVVPRNYETLEGLQTRNGAHPFLQRDPTGSFGSNITSVGPIDGGIHWAGPNFLVMSDAGDIAAASAFGGASIIKFAMTPTTQIWTFAIAPDSTGAEKVWCMPTNALNAAAAAPQKWDGVAGTTSAWGGGVPNVSLPGTSNANISRRPGGICFWKTRMIVWNAAGFRARVFYSDKGNPESPATANYGNNFQDFPDDDSSEGITMCIPLQESMLVFREKGIWQVYDPSTFANKRLSIGIGCGFRGQACTHPNGRTYFMSNVDNQIYSISLKGDLEWESKDIRIPLNERLWEIKDQLMLGPKRTIILKQFAGANPCVYEFIPKTPGKGAWFRHNFPGASLYNTWFSAGSWSSNDYSIVGNGSSSTLTLYTYFQPEEDPIGWPVDTTSFSDTPIVPTPSWMTSWRPFLSQEPIERLRRFHVVGHGRLGMNFYAEPHPVAGPTSKFLVVAADIPEPGGIVGAVGPARYSRGFTTARPETRGRYHAVRFSGAASTGFVLDEAEFVFRGGKEHVQS